MYDPAMSGVLWPPQPSKTMVHLRCHARASKQGAAASMERHLRQRRARIARLFRVLVLFEMGARATAILASRITTVKSAFEACAISPDRRKMEAKHRRDFSVRASLLVAASVIVASACPRHMLWGASWTIPTPCKPCHPRVEIPPCQQQFGLKFKGKEVSRGIPTNTGAWADF